MDEYHVIYVHHTVYCDIHNPVNVVKAISKVFCMCCDINLHENNYSMGHLKAHSVQKPVNQNLSDLSMSKSDLTYNQGVHSREKPCQCCIYDLKVYYNMSNTNVNSAVVQTNEITYKCILCDKGVLIKSNSNYNQVMHTGERPYQYCVCDISVYNRSNDNVNKAIFHTKEITYKGSICEKGRLIKSNLNYNQGAHTGERPYQCCVCDISVYYMSNTNSYRTIFQTKEITHNCIICDNCIQINCICGLSACHRSNMNVNITIIQTREKPCQCIMCEKSVLRKSDSNATKELTQKRSYISAKYVTYTYTTKCNHMGFMKLRKSISHRRSKK